MNDSLISVFLAIVSEQNRGTMWSKREAFAIFLTLYLRTTTIMGKAWDYALENVFHRDVAKS